MNIFVGNLSFGAAEEDVKKLFEGFGNVVSAVIVMSKDKKTPKSRGFGFVEMSDEEHALAAIAGLNGKEFMGRVLNVEVSRPKTEAQRENELEEKRQARLKAKAEAEQHLWEEQEQEKPLVTPVLNKPGTYKGGRRTRSFVKRHGPAGIQLEVKPRRRLQDNPGRWRKNKDQSKPWQKSSGQPKPWEKAATGDRPSSGQRKPREKAATGDRSWKKAEGEPKPWSKSSQRPQKSAIKYRSKAR